MGELSIKIKIGDREYPMKVKAEDEAKIRNAGRIINERIKNYKDQFGIDDKQDLLAMVAFDCMVDRLRSDEQSVHIDTNVLEKVTFLNNLISQHFNPETY